MKNRRTIGRVMAGLGLIVATLATITAAPATAYSYVVNSTADLSDFAPGDGVCETAPGNRVCTLRASVEEANANGQYDVITLPAGWFELSTGEELLVENQGIEIRGASSELTTISGANLTGIFFVYAGDLSLKGVTLRDGRAEQNGGAIWAESQAEIDLYRVRVVGNSAVQAGGALYLNASTKTTITETEIYKNWARSAGGIWADSEVSIKRSEISYNNARNAAAVYNRGSMTMANVTVSSNWISEPGGLGGVAGIRNNGGMTLNAVTVAYNRSHGEAGGYEGGGLSTSDPSGLTSAEIRMNNSIVYGNVDTGSGANDCAATIADNSLFNLMGDTTGCDLPPSVWTWLIDVDPLLGSLHRNGGETRTHAIPFTSPARDAAYTSGSFIIRGTKCPKTDQRSVWRSTCDMGAYENRVMTKMG